MREPKEIFLDYDLPPEDFDKIYELLMESLAINLVAAKIFMKSMPPDQCGCHAHYQQWVKDIDIERPDFQAKKRELYANALRKCVKTYYEHKEKTNE